MLRLRGVCIRMRELEKIPCEKYENECSIRKRKDEEDCGGIIYCKNSFGNKEYSITGKNCRVVEKMNLGSELINKMRSLSL